MRVPLSWLRDFVAVDGDIGRCVDSLATVLAELGLPVESVERVGEGLDGVVVARVLSVGPIEGADRIRVVQVEAGGPEPTQVVCGAWNFEAGAMVPLATVGSTLPGDFKIGARKMKGVRSEGMLCAPGELGLPAGDTSGILVLPEGLEPGAPFAEAVGITPDVVFDLEVNANRPDAMSIVGVARDLAARLGLDLVVPLPAIVSDGAAATSTTAASVVVEAPDICGRFVGQVLGGITVGPSPAWLAARLTMAGMRPINNVVDASNYVMLERGVPNHAYDLARLAGPGLRVRRARPGEVLVTLDGVERRLDEADCLICDAEDTPVGIAGVMGGASSEIGADTVEVLLESAWWQPLSIARTSRRLKLRTEASARFEKGVDWTAIDGAVARFGELLAESGARSTGSPLDIGGDLPDRAPIRLRVPRVNQLLGTDLSTEQVQGYLDPLGFTTTTTASTAGTGELQVALPPWRPDSSIEIDVVEEVARLHGYDVIARTVPRSPRIGGLTEAQRDRRRVRSIFAGAGASEAWCTTFLSSRDVGAAGLDPAVAVRVTNPLDVEAPLLRPSLLPGLLNALAYNADRRNRAVDLFEVGHVFARPPDGQALPDEREMVAVAVGTGGAGEAVEVWQALVDGLGLRTVGLEATTAPGLHPGRAARLSVAGAPVGVVGEVDPGVLAAFELDGRVGWIEFDLAALLATPHGPQAIEPVSRFPSSDVDLAFVVEDDVAAGAVEATLREADPLVEGVALFDVYRGDGVAEGRRSLAYSVRFQALDRTLTDEEVGQARLRLISAVEASHPAQLR